jgi:hypothetical protein
MFACQTVIPLLQGKGMVPDLPCDVDPVVQCAIVLIAAVQSELVSPSDCQRFVVHTRYYTGILGMLTNVSIEAKPAKAFD